MRSQAGEIEIKTNSIIKWLKCSRNIAKISIDKLHKKIVKHAPIDF